MEHVSKPNVWAPSDELEILTSEKTTNSFNGFKHSRRKDTNRYIKQGPISYSALIGYEDF